MHKSNPRRQELFNPTFTEFKNKQNETLYCRGIRACVVYFFKSKGMRNTKYRTADPRNRKEERWGVGQGGAHQWNILIPCI